MFFNNIAAKRKSCGLTQTQLASIVGVSKNTISSIETLRSCPSAFLALKFLIVFDCKFEELFGFIEESIE